VHPKQQAGKTGGHTIDDRVFKRQQGNKTIRWRPRTPKFGAGETEKQSSMPKTTRNWTDKLGQRLENSQTKAIRKTSNPLGKNWKGEGVPPGIRLPERSTARKGDRPNKKAAPCGTGGGGKTQKIRHLNGEKNPLRGLPNWL